MRAPLYLAALLCACGSILPDGSYVGNAFPEGGVDASSDTGSPRGRREQCNGIDDDLDGRIDEGCPIRLTTDSRHDSLASLSGMRLAWIRFEPGAYVGDLMVRDLPAGVERKVASNASAPSVSGNRIAFWRSDHIVILDLTTSEETTLDHPDAQYVLGPWLDGDRVTWSQMQSGTEEDYEVFVYELVTKQRYVVGAHDTIQEYPLLRGNTLVWNDDRLGHHTVGLLHLYDVFRADLTTGRPANVTQVTHRNGELTYNFIAALDGDRVAITETRGPLLGSYQPRPCIPVVIDLQTGARTALAPETRECFNAVALSGNRAVLEFDSLGVSDLYLVDVRTGARQQITNNPRRSTRARLDGNLLVWQDDRNDTWDLYMMDLTDAEQGDLYPEGIAP